MPPLSIQPHLSQDQLSLCLHLEANGLSVVSLGRTSSPGDAAALVGRTLCFVVILKQFK